MFILSWNRKASDLSLVEANCAASCLDFKGRLGASGSGGNMYRVAAGMITAKMGAEPDIVGDADTRVELSRFERRVTRRATGFVLANSEIIVNDVLQAYTYANALMLNFPEGREYLEWFRGETVVPAVDHLIEDATALQARL